MRRQLADERDMTIRAQRLRANVKGTFARMTSNLPNLGHAPISYTSDDLVIPVYYNYVNIHVVWLYAAYRGMLMLVLKKSIQMDHTPAFTS
jgi:hypothetical protein